MSLQLPSTDPNDLYYRDRILAVSPFDPVEFAKTFEHRRAWIDNVNLHYVIGGNGPVIIFGHGWPASWYEWRKVMPQLSDRFTCVAFDLPGLGDSTPPTAFDTGTISELIKKFITEHLEQEKVFVVGHDVSGPPLAHLAAYNPHLVEKLFFTETSVDGPEMGEILLQHINEIWHFPMNAARLSPSFATGREEQFIPQFFTDWVYNVGAIQPQDIAEYVRVNKKPGVIECGASYYNRPLAYTDDGKVLPEKSLTIPLKYIGAEFGFGGHLGGDEKRAYRTIARFATNSSYEVVDRCSHWVSEDRPVYIAQKIAKFFSA